MARLARAEIFDPSEIVAVHLIGKTVRSCYLYCSGHGQTSLRLGTIPKLLSVGGSCVDPIQGLS